MHAAREPEPGGPVPDVSVVVVSDYAGGEEKSWNDLRATLRALASQDFDGRAEFLLCEREDIVPQIPADVRAAIPGMRIVASASPSSYAMKNAGVRAAAAAIVGMLDADCVPQRSWLRRLVEVMRRHPNASAVSGRTIYPGDRLIDRLLALLSRAYLDPGRGGRTRYISNNNAGFRRSAFLAHPLPVDAGPFASRLQSEHMLRSGGELRFEPDMLAVHDFEGWPMEADIRRHAGYGTVIVRLHDRHQPYAWLTRLGYASIPLIVAGKLLDSLWSCLRCGRHYRVRWFELPAAFALAGVVHLMEVPGMIRAFAGSPIVHTAYR